MNSEENSIIDIERLRSEKELLEEIKALPKDQQRAVIWLLYHIEFLDIIDSGKILPQEEIDHWLERSIVEHDLGLQVLVNYKIQKDQQRLKT